MENFTISLERGINDSAYSMDEVNEFEREKHFGVMIFLVIILVFGIIGNVLVIIIYKTKFKRSSARVYIIGLAFADLSVCIVGIPYHVIDLTYLVTYPDALACKVLSFFIGACTLSSVFILLVVGLDRFLRVCRPLKKQIVDFGDRKSCFIAVTIACVFNIPYGFVYGHSSVYMPDYNVTGVECFIADEYTGSGIATAFLGFNLLLFLFAVATLVIIYALICRTIYKHDRMNAEITLKKTRTVCLCCKIEIEDEAEEGDDVKGGNSSNKDDEISVKAEPSVQMSDLLENEDNDDESESNVSCSRPEQAPLRDKKQNNAMSGSKSEQDKPKKKSKRKLQKLSSGTMIRHSGGGALHKEKNTIKITLMMFTITIVFIITILPLIILSILDSIDEYFWTELAHHESVIYDLLLRFYLLNNVINPVIYGFWDDRFRREILRLLKKVVHPTSDSQSSSSGSENGGTLISTLKQTRTRQ